jgi:hypothetical protein
LQPSHPEDVAAGWQKRIIPLRCAKKPDEHFMLVNGTRYDIPSLICDDCGKKLEDGSDAFAVTMWQGEDAPPDWESDYMGKVKA